MAVDLTDNFIKSLKPPEKRRDFWDSKIRGLVLRVTPDGVKSFSAWRRLNGKPRRFTIGHYPLIGLADARRRATEVLAGWVTGQDLQAERMASRRALDFVVLAERFVEARTPNLASSTATEYRRVIKASVAPSRLGRTPAPEVSRSDIREFLEAIARRSPIMANRIFQFVRAVCRWAMREELLAANPAEGLQKPRKDRQRERVLRDEEVLALWRVLDEPVPGRAVPRPAVAGVVKMLLLLGQRSTETVEMRWCHLDLTAKIWTIPGAYRKGNRLHVVPLPALAVRIIAGLRSVTGDTPRLFDGVSEDNAQRDWWGPTRDRAMELIRAETGKDPERFSKHDLRRTCATGCARLGASPFVVSKILGHATQPGALTVTAIYDRYDRLPEMRAALNAWSAHVERLVRRQERRTNVVPIRTAHQTSRSLPDAAEGGII